MHLQKPIFKTAAARAIEDKKLQVALDGLATGFVARRATSIAACPNFEELRDQARSIRQNTLASLDKHLVNFESAALQAGTHVHWAETRNDACATIERLCRDYQCHSIIKGKSMVSEEIGLNRHLEQQNFDVIETDLGEYLLQLRGEVPTHIIAPAIHLTEDDARLTFQTHHRQLEPDRPLATPESLVAEARALLRKKFTSADVGITGANFLIAETGSAVIVTNEGNGDLTATLPKHHIIITSIEKVVPTLAEVAVLLQVLARSATGQDMTAYTSFFTGPKRGDDLDGPETLDIVILDGGRSELLGSDAGDVLTCIRCGACLNHCPVYGAIGGQAYGWIYPGPIGAALDPALFGVGETRDLPHASSLCGRCEAVCPVRIPLPKIFRHWRHEDFKRNRTKLSNIALRAWGWLALRPELYHVVSRFAAKVLASTNGWQSKLPLISAWAKHRDLPAPEGTTFQTAWQRELKKRGERGDE